MTPYERVRQSRELTAATFPLPSVLDCIRYAITELAEYDDALLRQERTGDKRNNDKTHDPRSELGQALYMLLSAAVQGNGPLEYDDYWSVGTMAYAHHTAMGRLVEALFDLRIEAWAGGDMDAAYTGIVALCALHGWDVDALIDDTCAAFEAKHAPAREAR